MANTDSELKIKVTADTKGFDTGMKHVKDKAKTTAKSVGSSLKKMEAGADKMSNFYKASVGGVAVSAAVELGEAIIGMAEDADKAERALRGLDAISRGYGQNVDEVRRITKELTDDGLVSMPKMAQAVKNWMSLGYSPEQTKKIIQNNKEIAINNRIVEDLGDSLIDTSKGFKTNSQELIENSGVMKIQGAYTQGVIDKQTVLNGILEQGKRNTGAVEAAMNDYGTKVKLLDTQFDKLKISIGKGLKEPLSDSMVILTKLLKGLTDFSDKANERTEIAKIAQELYSHDLEKKAMTGNESPWARAAGVSQVYWDKAKDQLEERKHNSTVMPNTVEPEKKPETIGEGTGGAFKADTNTGLIGIGESGIESFGANMGGEFGTSAMADKALEAFHTKSDAELAAMDEVAKLKKQKFDDEVKALQDKVNRENKIRDLGHKVFQSIAADMAAGRIKNLSDLKKAGLKSIAELMRQKASENIVKGGDELVAAAIAAADPVTYELVPGHLLAAGKAFAYAAAMGVGAGAVGGQSEGGSSGDTSNNTPEPTARTNENDLNNQAEDIRGRVTVNVDSEELYGIVYNKVKGYAKDNDLDFIISSDNIKSAIT